MIYKSQSIVVDDTRRSVECSGTELQLPDLSFDLLLFLMKNAPHPARADDMAEAVWSQNHVTEETVAQRVALLRKSLSDDPKTPRYIRTVRGAGYAFCGHVEKIEAPIKQRRMLLNAIDTTTPRNRMVAVAVAFIFIGLATVAIKEYDFESFFQNSASVSALKTRPNDITILVERAERQLDLHQSTETDRAIKMLRAALEDDPENTRAAQLLSLGLSNRATKFNNSIDDKKEAESLARGLLSDNAEDSIAWHALGFSLDAQGRVDESLAAYKQAYSYDPENAAALSSASYLLFIKGQLFGALEMEAAAARTGKASRYSEVQIATILEFLDRPEARTWYEKAAKFNPGQIVTTSELAKHHQRAGRYQQALEVLDTVSANDKFSSRIVDIRGRLLIALDRVDDAKALWVRAAHSDTNLAALLATTGEQHAAMNKVEKITSLILEGSSWPGLRIQLAELYAALGDEGKAANFLGQAIDLGWRDNGHLIHSPFLKELMTTATGKTMSDRIERELDAQRALFQSTEILEQIIAGDLT